jgi:PAS domain S-box-containing protein
MIQLNKNYVSWWDLYKNHVRKVVLKTQLEDKEKVSYWRNAVFCDILTYLTPLSLIALIPSVFMAFTSDVPVVGFMDLFSFFTVVFVTIIPGIKLEIRKAIFIFLLYCLSIILLYYLPLSGSGLLFLLTITIFSSLIYSTRAAYFTAWTNTIVSACFAFLIYLELEIPISYEYTTGSWIATSSNLVLFSFACAKCLDLLLAGLTSSLKDNKISEAKLEKANRLYQFISHINQTIVHVKDAETLFSKSCNIAIDIGKYKMAWIGKFDLEQNQIKLVESIGLTNRDEKLFAEDISETNDAQEYVKRTGKYFLCNDPQQKHELESWKPFVKKHNIGSFIVLPIKKSGNLFGTFNLYAAENNCFDNDDIIALLEVTGDISFALDMFDKAERYKEAEIELKINYEELEALSKEQSTILNTLPASIALLDKEGNIVKVNEEWRKFGEDNDIAIGYSHLNTNYIEVSEKSLGRERTQGKQMAEGLKQILSGKIEYFSMEYPCDSPTEKRWFKAEVRPFKSNEQNGAVVMHFDISERKRAEAEMILLINNTEEAFILMNNNLEIISFNNQFENLYKEYFGVEIQKGRIIIDYVLPERKEIVTEIYKKVLEGNVEVSEITIPLPNKTNKNFTLKYNPARDDLGNIFGVFVTAADITERKKAEEQKEFERRDKEALINTTDDSIWSISNDFKLIAANNSFINEIKKYLGVELKQGDDLLDFEILPTEYLAHWEGLYSRALSGESFKIEIYTPPTLGNDESWIETNFNPIIINEQIVGAACYTRNITERKKAELLLRANETRLAEAQAIAKIGNWETDLLTSNVIWSEQTYKIFDINPDDFILSHPNFLNFVHIDDRSKVEKAFKNSFSEKGINTVEHRIITKKGELKYVEEKWQIIHDNDDKAIKAIGTCQDITERKNSEYEIKFKAELLDTIGQAVIVTDLNGRIIFWNKAAVEIYGWTTEEAIGKNTLELTSSTQTLEDAEIIMNKLSKGESWSGEFYVKRKDETTFPAFVYNSPVFDEFDKLVAVIGVSNDISDLKENEKERTKITNDLLQRNRDLEQFTFIISHNLRAPTANIIGFTEILQDETLPNQLQKELLKGLSSSVLGLDNVIKDINSILQVKREVNEKKETVSFTKLVNDIVLSIENIIEKHRVQIKIDFSEVDEIFSLKAYMHSVFYNLISNSIKYSKPDEQPIIEIKSKLEEGKIILTFKDNGLGIDLKTKGDKVFGLYKRFHSHVEGKGMGLFMVKTQVEAIGGTISLESELDKGTEFTIVFKN